MKNSILIVDDMAFNRKQIKAVLKDMQQIEFYDAEDGFQAIKEVEDNDIDLIILDLMMPGKDGFDVLRELKANEKYKHIPVIVYSGMDNIDSVNQALELGAYDFFSKTLTIEQKKFVVPVKVKNALDSYVQRKMLLRMHEKMKLELMLASVFQQTLMTTSNTGSLADMYGKYLACDEIGGNFYECVQFEDSIWFIMADVSSHGVAAAMIASMIKVDFTNSIKYLACPAEVLHQMNNTFYSMMQGDYSFTAIVGKMQGNVLTFANAGHSYPMVYTHDTEQVHILYSKDRPVGLEGAADYNAHKFVVSNEDIIFLYTDGLFNTREQYDMEMNYQDLSGCFMNYKHIIQENPEEFFNIVLRLFAGISDEKVMDDVSMMLIKVH
ncbi:PP2C family protein-serine/threonine phosphatase [Pelosinus propionicus]|uniref:Response regulator receiver domain-containing protein n=1 Tax=Pelosinus propionicus DSM 13327 TaxID=1123291 RepID=A0A1I4GPW0_9FIRM|nr:fused response regulator/phosphatase [Pelosinus propionicus]SFL31201.1 Response regulator receiver domain-containing protein [Pelosinus propionicus DSM 13327]